MSAETSVEHVTCLGCGCGCDDITVQVREGRIVGAGPVCSIGQAWLGDGRTPSAVLVDGHPASLDRAVAETAAILSAIRERCLVYLAPDLTSQAQRSALGLADNLRATVETATSATAAEGLLAGQRRGRAAATLGEIRNRADILVFWGVDPSVRYPRYLSRYALDPTGIQVPDGRRGRTTIAVTIGTEQSLAEADLTLELEPQEEIPMLSLMRASVLGQPVAVTSAAGTRVLEITGRLVQGRYVVLVHDAEPRADSHSPLRAEALIALAQALNGPTRAAVSSLRGGGNRVGAEAVLTSHTGYPFAVDYSRGYPRYQPTQRGQTRITSRAFDALLVVGSPILEGWSAEQLSSLRIVAIGPRASTASFKPRVAIDTGVAGIHERGTAYRMDEVPLELRAPLPGAALDTTQVLDRLGDAVRARLALAR